MNSLSDFKNVSHFGHNKLSCSGYKISINNCVQQQNQQQQQGGGGGTTWDMMRRVVTLVDLWFINSQNKLNAFGHE